MPKVSIVIPVYGVENYIERCARSLFEQTLDDIEFIFVNDCTKDRSIEVLERVLKDYPNRICQVRILNHKENGGQAKARTTGTAAATGEYIIHCDSDDWVDKRMYETLYERAKSSDADIVVCNHYYVYSHKKIATNYKNKGTPREWLTNFSGSWTCWDKLVRLSIIREHDIYPFEGLNFSEDRCVMMRVFYFSKKIEFVEESLYYYDKTREEAITNLCVKDISLLHQREKVMLKMEQWFKNVGFDMGEQMLRWKYSMSLLYLSAEPTEWNSWKRYLPEVGKYIIKGKFNLIKKTIYWFALKGFYLPIKIVLLLKKLNNDTWLYNRCL